MKKEEKDRLNYVLAEIENEWFTNMEEHCENRHKHSGIRSSQISALVAYLIKEGIIK